METLQLNHLAGYLPHDLQCMFLSEPDSKEPNIKTLHGIEKGFESDIVIGMFDEFDNSEFNYFKPILRPLSDLTKEIEVDGEKFVPIDWIEKNNPTKDEMPCAIMLNGFVEMHYYRDYEKLFEWHFDVFGLIEKGLAIDINTLK
jgi:hypothetical protein